jgi:hypothetical protein
MNDLVQRLATGDHPVEISIRPDRTPQALKECLERGYVHIKFTDTRGGTELGVRLDRAASELNGDFDRGNGHLKLVGNLVLNYEPVQCVADIDLATLTGTGHLKPTPS